MEVFVPCVYDSSSYYNKRVMSVSLSDDLRIDRFKPLKQKLYGAMQCRSQDFSAWGGHSNVFSKFYKKT